MLDIRYKFKTHKQEHNENVIIVGVFVCQDLNCDYLVHGMLSKEGLPRMQRSRSFFRSFFSKRVYEICQI